MRISRKRLRNRQTDEVGEVRRLCVEAATQAVERLASFIEGAPEITNGALVGAGHAGSMLLSPPCTEDPEHRLGASRGRLQFRFAPILDKHALSRMSAELLRLERWPDARRMRELSDETVSHDWLWSIGTAEGGGMCNTEYLIAVRLRIGAEHY
jgi:hypothetical protein